MSYILLAIDRCCVAVQGAFDIISQFLSDVCTSPNPKSLILLFVSAVGRHATEMIVQWLGVTLSA